MSRDAGRDSEDPTIEGGAQETPLTASIHLHVQSLEHRRIEISQKV